jgi:hypothetical protein
MQNYNVLAFNFINYFRLSGLTWAGFSEPVELPGHALSVAGRQPDLQRGRDHQGRHAKVPQQGRLLCRQ